MDTPHVAAICGSLREESHTRTALDHALSEAADAGATTDHIDLRNLDLPVYSADEREAGDANDLLRRVERADSVILGSPVYHASYSSALKNALDYCGFDQFEDTTVGLLAVAGGSFPVTALEHMRSVSRGVRAWVLPHQVAIPKIRTQFENGDFVDENVAERVEKLGRQSVEYAFIEPNPRPIESAGNVTADD